MRWYSKKDMHKLDLSKFSRKKISKFKSTQLVGAA